MRATALLPAFTVACALLVVAGAAKLRSPQPARDALRLIGVPVPTMAVRLLGAAEIGLGVLAALRPSPVPAGLAAFAYAAFCATAVLLLRADRNADCGCFGQASSSASLVHVALNAAAAAVATATSLAGPPGVLWISGRQPLVALPLLLGIAGATFAAFAVFTLLAPAWRAYGSGTEA